MDEVSWHRALAWWPHGELLRTGNAPAGVARESVFRSGEGEDVPDPKKEYAAISVFYWNEKGSPFAHYFPEIRAAGGIQISVDYYPAGETIPWSEGFFTQEPVVVRGQPGRLVELRKGQNANVDWRAVRWEQPAAGGTLQWTVSNHPDRYSREQTLAFIEELVPAGDG